MATKIVEIEDKYDLNSGALILKVILGDGQPGSYNVFLDDKLLTNSASINLGDSASLKGKKLSVVATIRDARKETNWTSVTLELSDGTPPKKLGPYTRKVDEDFGKIIYSIDVDLL